MYRLFCNNLKNYIEINKKGDFEREFRLKIIKPLIVLSNIEQYNKFKLANSNLLDEVENLVFRINENIDAFHSFKSFSWELWAYGFDKKCNPNFPQEIVDEQLKLIDLLLSCHYWIAA